MVNGITFQEQLITSANMAHFMYTFLNKTNGITKGCSVSTANDNINIAAGYFIVHGRMVQVVGTEAVAAPSVESGTLYCRCVFEIDLTKENTAAQFNQGYFKILSDAQAYPTVTQQDLDAGGTLYQMKFCKFTVSVAGVADFFDERDIVNLDTIWNVITAQNAEYRAAFNTFYAAQQAAVLAELAAFMQFSEDKKDDIDTEVANILAEIAGVLTPDVAGNLLNLINMIISRHISATLTDNLHNVLETAGGDTLVAAYELSTI